MAEHLHVVPQNDLIAHCVDEVVECICRPRTEFVDNEFATGWVLVHNSLDGREKAEESAAPQVMLEQSIYRALDHAAKHLVEHRVPPERREEAVQGIAAVLQSLARDAAGTLLEGKSGA